MTHPNAAAFLDIAPLETFAAAGAVLVVAAGLILTAAALVIFLLVRYIRARKGLN